MLVFKVTPVFLFILVVGAEKKIELEDIEEDNLKSEKEQEVEKSEARTQNSGNQGLLPLEFLKNGFLRYFESPTHSQAAPQQQRYVSQYAVTEPPESPPTAVASTKVQYGPPAAQQAMVGYLSNVPMQIYLVPQYFNDHQEQTASAQPGVQYVNTARTIGYSTAPEAVQSQANYVEVPSYVAPTGKTFVQQYSPPLAYVSYTQPTVAPTTVAPVYTYQVPVQYPTAIAAPPVNKGYYQTSQFEGNSLDNDNEEVKYTAATEEPYTKSTPEFPRYYTSQAPIREQYRHGTVSELPPPNPLILKPQPSHLSHLPKALPYYRPLTKSVYSGNHLSSGYTSRPFDAYGPPYKRRPSSLLDSYIPSSVQLEYMKRGYTKDPLLAYEELSSGRHLSHSPSAHSSVHSHSISHSPVIPRHYERGFLPNQMYHTAAGGVTFGHYKRTPKIEHKALKN